MDAYIPNEMETPERDDGQDDQILPERDVISMRYETQTNRIPDNYHRARWTPWSLPPHPCSILSCER